MKWTLERRDLLKLMGVGGVVFASRLTEASGKKIPPKDTSKEPDFFFLQLSDTHWGFSGPPNPEAATTLKKTVEVINSSSVQPDFIVFTGDLTHTTDDPAVRRTRMRELREITSKLKATMVKYLPGEHDAALDRGEAYQEHFGPLHYSFDHKGIHFVALDNVSDPGSSIGEAQLVWLAQDLAKLDPKAPLVVFAHRPLFDLFPSWDWATRDGAKAIDLLARHEHVTVFYGHIHQEHTHATGRITHHAARSLIFALPAPGSVPKKGPISWDAANPGKGLGYRSVALSEAGLADRIVELASTAAPVVPKKART